MATLGVFAYSAAVSPTLFRWKGYRFFFFSREEQRMHVHVYCADGEAKFWIEPEISLAKAHGLTTTQITEMMRAVQEHKDEITDGWQRHFGH
jgi:hypothetical protein